MMVLMSPSLLLLLFLLLLTIVALAKGSIEPSEASNIATTHISLTNVSTNKNKIKNNNKAKVNNETLQLQTRRKKLQRTIKYNQTQSIVSPLSSNSSSPTTPAVFHCGGSEGCVKDESAKLVHRPLHAAAAVAVEDKEVDEEEQEMKESNKKGDKKETSRKNKNIVLTDRKVTKAMELDMKNKLAAEFDRLYGSGSTIIDKIDVVITWVNASDPEFAKQFKLADKDKCGKVCSMTETEFYERYTPTNEILLNIMTLCYGNDWVRNIFIVSNEQFDLSYFMPVCRNRIRFIRHETILPKKYLPMYNSNIIEASLHKIPNISEIFMYSNDDIMLTQKFNISKLVKKDNYPINIMSSYFGKQLCNNNLNNVKQAYSVSHFHVYFNSWFIFADKFNMTNECYPWSFRGHSPFLVIKPLLELTWELFSKELNRVYSNRFRYEKHYKKGGDFCALYLSSYIGKYLGVSDFTDKIFHSSYPRGGPAFFFQKWKDRNVNSIVMHDSYNSWPKNTRFKLCNYIVTKACKEVSTKKLKNCTTTAIPVCQL